MKEIPALALALLAAMPPMAASAASRSTSAIDKACAADAGWDDPSPPRLVFDNTWFVGTCGISAVLVTSTSGHVLIDGGTSIGGPLVAANIEAAGFQLRDVKYIVNSHPHDDHAGGIAHLQKVSGATVLALAPSAEALRRGRGDRSDPQFDISKPFPPVPRDKVRVIENGFRLRLGDIDLTAHATPGHTPGSTSWTWERCEGDTCARIAYVDSVSAISDDTYKYSDEAAHPGYLAAFRAALETITGFDCNLLITPHPGASELWQRVGPGANAPLLDDSACRRYAQRAGDNLTARIAKESEARKP